LDLLVVDPDAVGASVVDDPDPAVHQLHVRVASRDPVVLDDDRAVVAPSDRRGAVAEGDLLPLLPGGVRRNDADEVRLSRRDERGSL
jgi:hypothetical protein